MKTRTREHIKFFAVIFVWVGFAAFIARKWYSWADPTATVSIAPIALLSFAFTGFFIMYLGIFIRDLVGWILNKISRLQTKNNG